MSSAANLLLAPKADDSMVGTHFMSGDHACAEGAIYAGCRFFAGYPITPATEIAEHLAERLPALGGQYIQMEDEIASVAAILGASVAGAKSMTATSGPGFSLMMENLGLGIMMEVPTVIVNVQRGGPSTGLPTSVGQQDMMQARFGSHGDFTSIALSPQSPQEAFDLTVHAFNVAEKLRTPVLLMMDEVVGHMHERVIVPPPGQIPIRSRTRPTVPPAEYRPYKPGPDLVPPMALAGDGYAVRFTSLTHNELGQAVTTYEVQKVLVPRLRDKVLKNREVYERVELYKTEGATTLIVSYGITARSARRAVDLGRAKGHRIGMLRLLSVWPFPAARLLGLKQIRRIVVAEVNMGQVVLEVERLVSGSCPVIHVGTPGGLVPLPETILDACLSKAGGKA
ncbi:MAG TPA: 2-oxoacid:acceptor oxidoreductase subunit alpha [Thermoplasmata archaeon]|nr:2-oxoacid:acceptor oxidoreductase subunit alpha [Thermoplasmata archaeon]